MDRILEMLRTLPVLGRGARALDGRACTPPADEHCVR